MTIHANMRTAHAATNDREAEQKKYRNRKGEKSDRCVGVLVGECVGHAR